MTPIQKKRSQKRPKPAQAQKEEKVRPSQPGTPPSKLSSSQKKYLRGLGHRLNPLVRIGKDGISPSLIASVQEALIDHELVKIRMLKTCELDKNEVGEEIAEKAGAFLVQRVGKTMLLYAPHPDEPTIELPRPGKGKRDE